MLWIIWWVLSYYEGISHHFQKFSRNLNVYGQNVAGSFRANLTLWQDLPLLNCSNLTCMQSCFVILAYSFIFPRSASGSIFAPEDLRPWQINAIFAVNNLYCIIVTAVNITRDSFPQNRDICAVCQGWSQSTSGFVVWKTSSSQVRHDVVCKVFINSFDIPQWLCTMIYGANEHHPRPLQDSPYELRLTRSLYTCAWRPMWPHYDNMHNEAVWVTKWFAFWKTSGHYNNTEFPRPST